MCIHLSESRVLLFLLPSGLPGGGASGSYHRKKKKRYIAITYSSPSGLPRSEAAFHHAHARSKRPFHAYPLCSLSSIQLPICLSAQLVPERVRQSALAIAIRIHRSATHRSRKRSETLLPTGRSPTESLDNELAKS